MGVRTPSCICGPQAGNWDVYTPTRLIVMSGSCKRAENRGELAFVCPNSTGGCRWWRESNSYLYSWMRNQFLLIRTAQTHVFRQPGPLKYCSMLGR